MTSILQQTLRRQATASKFSPFTLQSRQKSTAHPTLSYLHFHPTTSAPRSDLKYAVSYVSSDNTPKNELIIGWTPSTDIDYKTFVDNMPFVDFMTRVLKENIHKVNDINIKSLAEWQKEGWLHIADERNPPPWGRIPFPEDIIGTVLVRGGVIQPNTYEPMPTHRITTSNGIFQLSEPLTNCLVQEAKRVANE